MQIAFKNSERDIDRRVYIRNIEQSQLESIHDAGLTWNKSKKFFEGIPSVFMLEALAKMVVLPPALQALKNELEENQKSVDRERLSLNPKAVIEPPVRVKLYEHQVRALNMALERFGII